MAGFFLVMGGVADSVLLSPKLDPVAGSVRRGSLFLYGKSSQARSTPR
jgi:hypothetical protein